MLYHEKGKRQAEIAADLAVSQSRVSRLLKEAEGIGVVRTIVRPPAGAFPELELALIDRYGLRDAVVVGPMADDDATIVRSLGAAGAAFVEEALHGVTSIGLSSWSATLLATVDQMTPPTTGQVKRVTQVIGGVGNPGAQIEATRLTERFAALTGAEAVYLPVPGVVASRAARDTLLSDPQLAAVAESWSALDMVLLGVGAVEPSPLLKVSGNSLAQEALHHLATLGAVGDVCLRFFDRDGILIDSDLNDRIVGIEPHQLRAVPNKIVIAGGPRKVAAVRAAVTGGWVDVLITDTVTAREMTS